MKILELKNGFSSIELLVVMGIIGILTAIAAAELASFTAILRVE